MKWQSKIYALAVIVLLANQVKADIINFDPDGQGGQGAYSVGSFDFLQGNSLSEDVLLGGVGHEWTLYYQASLGSLVNPSGNVITGTGLNSSYQITAVAAITVRTTGLDLSGLTFERAANPTTNFMRLYYDTNLNSNALTGAGYNDGTLILDSLAETDMAGFFFFTTANAGALDQFNVNNWAGVNTRGGIGSFSVGADITYANSDFFQVNNPNESFDLLFANTSEIVPFRQTDPSQQFWDGSGFVATNIGSFNGVTGPDVLVQADANASFSVVPEASSFIMGGLGASLLAAIGFKRRKTA